eukprot:CAMPEP_0117478852 /NCGR_PEP_ID=MMETSP0784-20121206/11577_1 /TAXON_ID=39447 /ORGANISM="" /LENGTH=476 /DNA_ID=CAMNT_0005273249 /DNA_START=1 /DNA_END=1431 /DNA_ORIENTATION=+
MDDHAVPAPEGDAVSLRHFGYRLRVWWPSGDEACQPCIVELSAVRRSGKREFELCFDDGDSRWCCLDRKKLRFELVLDATGRSPPSSPAEKLDARRPLYFGSTDPGFAREWVGQRLRTAPLPICNVDTYYMCVGGLSGFDGVVALAQRGVHMARVVLFDRDDVALIYAELMLALIKLCKTRAELLCTIFGRCPEAWTRAQVGQRELRAESMLDYLRAAVDGDFLQERRRALPRRLRPHFDVLVQAAAHGGDADGQCDALPRRRLWPCWGMCRRLHGTKASLRGSGCGHETYHYGETGWLADDASYSALRSVVGVAGPEVTCRSMDLNYVELDPLRPDYDGHVLFISNADENSKFILSRDALERRLGQQGKVMVVSLTKITVVDGAASSLRLLAERTTRIEARAPRGRDAPDHEMETALQAFRRWELLHHLESRSKPLPSALAESPMAIGLRREGAEALWWRFTRLLSVLREDAHEL